MASPYSKCFDIVAGDHGMNKRLAKSRTLNPIHFLNILFWPISHSTVQTHHITWSYHIRIYQIGMVRYGSMVNILAPCCSLFQVVAGYASPEPILPSAMPLQPWNVGHESRVPSPFLALALRMRSFDVRGHLRGCCRWPKFIITYEIEPYSFIFIYYNIV